MAAAEQRYECSVCGSTDVELIEGECASGVAAPDGGLERYHYFGLKCLSCGSQEEL